MIVWGGESDESFVEEMAAEAVKMAELQ